mgnify:CR=1 FL=1
MAHRPPSYRAVFEHPSDPRIKLKLRRSWFDPRKVIFCLSVRCATIDTPAGCGGWYSKTKLETTLVLDDLANGTFTISNLGSFGIQEFTAIINPPGSAILAVGEIRKEPVVGENDELFIHSLMTLTLSCDHRVVDGAIGAAFLKTLKDMIEEPIQTLY